MSRHSWTGVGVGAICFRQAALTDAWHLCCAAGAAGTAQGVAGRGQQPVSLPGSRQPSQCCSWSSQGKQRLWLLSASCKVWRRVAEAAWSARSPQRPTLLLQGRCDVALLGQAGPFCRVPQSDQPAAEAAGRHLSRLRGGRLSCSLLESFWQDDLRHDQACNHEEACSTLCKVL